MAYTRRTYRRRRTQPKRTYRRSKRYTRRSTRRRGYRAVRQRGLAFSKSQVVKLRYCQAVQLNPAADSGAYIVYTANGPFAPNISASASVSQSAAHQPYGWDQWTAIYNDYVVIGSRVKVTATAPNSTSPSAGSGLITILLSDSPTPYVVTTSVGATTAIESGRATYRQFAPNTSQAPIKLSKSFSAKKFWNITNIKDNITRLGAAVSANPSEQAYFQIYFSANDESISTSSGPLCWIILDYLVIFSGPYDLAAS